MSCMCGDSECMYCGATLLGVAEMAALALRAGNRCTGCGAFAFVGDSLRHFEGCTAHEQTALRPALSADATLCEPDRDQPRALYRASGSLPDGTRIHAVCPNADGALVLLREQCINVADLEISTYVLYASRAISAEERDEHATQKQTCR